MKTGGCIKTAVLLYLNRWLRSSLILLRPQNVLAFWVKVAQLYSHKLRRVSEHLILKLFSVGDNATVCVKGGLRENLKTPWYYWNTSINGFTSASNGKIQNTVFSSPLGAGLFNMGKTSWKLFSLVIDHLVHWTNCQR